MCREWEGIVSLTDEQKDIINRLDGIFVGQLDHVEMSAFESAIKAGYAKRSYDGAGGWLGLAKVKLERLKE